MSSSAQCYWPNHEPADGNYPCSDAEITSCCGSTAICLSNGYCMDISQPYVLSRGACTSDTWASGCPTECQQSEFDFQGSSIINLSFTNGTSTYCCGTPVGSGNGNEVVCPYNYDSFELDDSHILAGYAALADYTTSNTTSNPSTDTSSSSNSPSQTPTAATNINSHDVALGAGLGVPLGIVALGSLLWALWERRRANKLSKAMMHSSGSGHGLFGSDKSPQMRLMTESSAPTELDSGRRIQELPGSH